MLQLSSYCDIAISNTDIHLTQTQQTYHPHPCKTSRFYQHYHLFIQVKAYKYIVHTILISCIISLRLKGFYLFHSTEKKGRRQADSTAHRIPYKIRQAGHETPWDLTLDLHIKHAPEAATFMQQIKCLVHLWKSQIMGDVLINLNFL